MIINEFQIDLEGLTVPCQATVTRTDNDGIFRFRVFTTSSGSEDFPEWRIEIEPDCRGWKQTPASLEAGPAMPCFFIEEIGEQIERRLGSISDDQ